jgi:hypothetical protein
MTDSELIELFEESKNYLLEILEPSFNVYLHQDLNPLTSYVLLRDAKKVLYKDLGFKVPDMPEEYYPQMLFNLDYENKTFEFNLQTYLNKACSLEFLGGCEYDGVVHDMYLSPRIEIEPWLVTRYGHDEKSHISGSTTARSEYHLGIMTPLAIAYSMAVDLGHIKE